MGCLLSTPNCNNPQRGQRSIGDVVVFLPGFRIPQKADLFQALGDCLPDDLLERFEALRNQVVVLAAKEAKRFAKPRRRRGGRYGGSDLAVLMRALEDYLPILLGLAKDGCQWRENVNFVWTNQEDDAEETTMANTWYEVLSILHLMAMLCLSQANWLLLPKKYRDGYQMRVTEESKKCTVDVLLKAAGYLDCALRQILTQIPSELRNDIPLDLKDVVLRALCLQALGQAVDIQLGMAIESPKATLAVKRRLACEMVKYWQEAQDNMSKIPSSDEWFKKHQLFVKWKYAEAKAAAYYYHGLIHDEANTEKAHGIAVAALLAAEAFLKESKKACGEFNSTPPTSRNPPLWGTMKYLFEKIPKDTSVRVRANQDLYSHERILEMAPALPDFALALKPDDYQLPPVDSSWSMECKHQSKFSQEATKL